MKNLLVVAAVLVAVVACVSLVASLIVVNFMVQMIPSTSPTQGDLFNNSIKSTASYLTIPAMVLLGFAFLAFLVFLLRMRRG